MATKYFAVGEDVSIVTIIDGEEIKCDVGALVSHDDYAALATDLDIAKAAAEQYRCDCRTYRRQLAERDATIAALQADLAMFKRPRAVPLVGTITDGVVTKNQSGEKS